MMGRRPAVIARCTRAADIQRAVAFCRERELLVAVRGGGHSFPGYSSCNGGVVIDLSGLRGVRVDPTARTAQVAGGAWNGDLDREAQLSASENPDLFWAIRGGGGNFGVVSSFEYRLHPVGPKVLAGEFRYARRGPAASSSTTLRMRHGPRVSCLWALR